MKREVILEKHISLNSLLLVTMAAAMLVAVLFHAHVHRVLSVRVASERQWAADSSWVKGDWE